MEGDPNATAEYIDDRSCGGICSREEVEEEEEEEAEEDEDDDEGEFTEFEASVDAM